MSYYHNKPDSFSYLGGGGGVLRPGALQANQCPMGIEHSATGECEGFISSVPSQFKRAPGHRHTHAAGGYALKPYQYQYNPALPCDTGYEPVDAGFVNSCRPQGSGHSLFQPGQESGYFEQRTLPSQRYPYTDGLYSYTF